MYVLSSEPGATHAITIELNPRHKGRGKGSRRTANRRFAAALRQELGRVYGR